MRRLFFILSLVFLLIGLVVLSACGGKSSSNTPNSVTKIAMSATAQAIDQGGKVRVIATPQDTNGATVTSATPTFSVEPNQNLISVSVNGVVCAGQWDSLTTPVICTPATASGESTVTATVGSVTGVINIAVLPPIDHVAVVPSTPDPAIPADPAGIPCISQSSSSTAYAANTRTYTIAASFKGVPVALSDAIKDTAVSWSIESGNPTGTIAAQTSTDTSGNTITDTRFGVATAKVPGRTKVNAVVGPAISSPDPNYHELIRPHQAVPADFTVCPVSQITIADNATPPTTLPLASAGTLTLTPTLTDSRGVPVFLSQTDTSGTSPVTTAIFGLSWTSLNPISAAVSAAAVAGTATVTASSNPGTTTVIATCTPPACNLGLGAVYSNAFVVPVGGTSSGTTVYVGSSAPAPDSNTTAPGKTLYPITTADNKVGTAITLGDVPNSMAFNRTGTLLYIGSASGLMTVTTALNTVTTPLTTAPGKILAISPNSTNVLLSDGSKVYVVDVTNNLLQTFNIAGATAADFAPDSSKAYIVGGNQFSVYATGIFPVPQPLTGATDVNFLASGPFGYVGDPAGLAVRATCNDLSSLVPYDTGTPGPIPLSPAPTFVRALPDGLHLITASSPDMNLIAVTTDAKGFLSPATGCAPNVSNRIVTTAALGSSFTPKQLIVSGDGTKAFVLSNSGTLLGATIDISAGTVTPVSIPLQTSVSGTPQSAAVQQTTGGITTDGKLLFFGGNDNQIHRIDLTAATPTDTPITLGTPPTGFTTDFVAVKP